MSTEQTAFGAGRHDQPRSELAGVPELEPGAVTDSSAMEWCAIVYERLRRQAKFHVVVTERDGSPRYVAGSPVFRAPVFGALRCRGQAKAAHELLVSRLTACGWRPVDAGGAWHELGFVRSIAAGKSTARSRVKDLREAGSARFAAEECDAYGNPTPLATSPAFRAPRRRPVPRTKEAEAAHEELLESLKSDGWEVVGSEGSEWFSVALERPTNEADRSHRAEVLTPRAADEKDVEGLVEAAATQDGPGDESIRAGAILALGELGPDAGSDVVAAAIHDPSPRVQEAAVQVLHSRAEIGLLAEALSSLPPKDEKTRELAFQAILEHRSSRVARAAVRALVRTPGDAPPSPADVAFVRALVRSEGGREQTKAVVRELLTALSEDRSEVAERAEELLVGLAPTSVPYVIAELENGHSPERAAIVLGRTGDSSALEPLIGALEHRHEDVRLQAAAALGALRDPAAVEPLLRATRDPDYDVRAEASHALDHLGAAGVIVGMSALLRSIVVEAVASAAELPPDRARRVVPQISAPARKRPFGGEHEATRLADELNG